MLFWIIGALSVILGFCVAIHVVFEKLGSKVTGSSVLITIASGIMLSAVTGLVMVTAVWPPVTIGSWLFFGVFACVVLLVLSTGNKKKRGGWSRF